MQFLRIPPAKEGQSSCLCKVFGLLPDLLCCRLMVLAVGLCGSFSTLSLHGGLVYWGSQGFVENGDSHARKWTPDFTMVLGVFAKDFVPLAGNRDHWLENWTELSKADFDSEEGRFAGVVDLTTALPNHSNPQVYLWASNGLDLTKGPEWLLMTQADWKWPSSSSSQSPALTWITGNSELVVVGAVDLDGYHLLTSRINPLPIPQQVWLQSYFPSVTGPIDPKADPDGDGVSNELEYHLGSNPNNGASSVSPLVTASQGDTVVQLNRNPYADSECLMEMSSDLKTWVRTYPELLVDRPDFLEMKVARDPLARASFFRFNFKPAER